MATGNDVPTGVTLHRKSGELELDYADGESFRLSCEYLRVFSPSAEVRGHSPDQAVLQTGKRGVHITAIKPVGNYALQLVFDDGHDTGLYAWDYLYALCINRDAWWQGYLDQLDRAGASRDPEVQVVKLVDPGQTGE